MESIDDYENDIITHINIEELAENNEKSKIVSESLSKLKELDRKIFITFYYNQKKIKEIAKIFKISEAKVKIILYRARKSIKRTLKERGYNYGE